MECGHNMKITPNPTGVKEETMIPMEEWRGHIDIVES